jgi:hypothetical protein
MESLWFGYDVLVFAEPTLMRHWARFKFQKVVSWVMRLSEYWNSMQQVVWKPVSPS